VSEFTAQALEYYGRGWCVLPMKAKRPACRWREYQRTRPDVGTVRRWFRQRDLDGLGVLAGAVSGGLVCRDYDQLESYERWAHEHPELAGTLPTALTARGRHVWFRADVARIIKIGHGDGELRGKDFTVLPPSRHPSGHVYAWAVPLPAGPLPIVDPFEAGLAPRVTERTEPIEPTEAIKVGEWGTLTVDQAIDLTQPSGVGERNDKVFEFARALLAVPGLAGAGLPVVRPMVRRWHERALPRIGTKPFEDSWAEFIRAWKNAKLPLGVKMSEILSRAEAAPLPVEALNYESEEVRRLLVLCRELQRMHGAKPFFLACRKAGEALELDHVSASRWLNVLVADGILEVVEKGRQAKSARRATRFRYLGKL